MKDVITIKGIEGGKRHSLATCEKSTRENELAFTWDCDEQSKWGGRAGGNHVKRYFVEKLREKPNAWKKSR